MTVDFATPPTLKWFQDLCLCSPYDAICGNYSDSISAENRVEPEVFRNHLGVARSPWENIAGHGSSRGLAHMQKHPTVGRYASPIVRVWGMPIPQPRSTRHVGRGGQN